MPTKSTLNESTSDRLIKALLDVSNLVGSVMRLEDILARIAAITAELMGVPACSIFLFDAERRVLVLRSGIGVESEHVGRAEFPPWAGVPGWVFANGEMLALPDAARDARFRALPSKLEEAYHACLCAPLRIQEEVVGVVEVRSPETRAFDRRERLLMETVCKMIAIVIEKARLYQEMIRARELAAVAVSLSGTAHFIKNILFTSQVAEATINHALAAGADIGRIRNAWDAVMHSNQQIGKLVGNMLNYCREDAPAFKRVDLYAVVRDLVEKVREQAQRRGIEIVLQLDPAIGEVELDVDAMQDALLNLITNAMDAIPSGRGGRVWVRTHRLPEQNNYRIEVADDGTGIPDDIRDKVFNLFFSTKGEGGSGIGLASTRKIIERHHGTIAVASTPGQGTCFTLYLPLHPADF